MADEGFHEIQLNGTLLVFLFMAAAVVAVVVFLSGGMVGRGVRAEKSAAQPGEAAPSAADLVAVGPATSTPQAPAAAAGLPAADAAPARPVTPPPPVADDIARTVQPEGRGRAAADPTAAPAPPAAREEPRKPAAAPASQPAAAAPRAETTAATYAVQVAAPTDRAAAEAIAKRLVGKGYSAYVLEPAAGGTAAVYYRVRVGPFKTRREADEARRRLEKEEQFKPFITTR